MQRYSFSCVRCGLCCRETGYVFFSQSDVRRASRALSMNADSFRKRYLKKIPGGMGVEVTEETPCIFLNEDGCGINNGKPSQCSSFPYWPEFINASGELTRFNRPCPGVVPFLGE